MNKCEICGTPNAREREGSWVCNMHYNQYLEYFVIMSEDRKGAIFSEELPPINLQLFIKESKDSLSEIISSKVKEIVKTEEISKDITSSGKFSPKVFKDSKTVKKMMKEFSTENSEINISDILVYLYAKQKSQEEIDRYEKEIESILNKL